MGGPISTSLSTFRETGQHTKGPPAVPPATTAKRCTKQRVEGGAHIYAKDLLSLLPGQAVLPHGL